MILPEHAADFVAALPIEKFHGIGQVTATKKSNLGIHTGADLKQYSQADLVRHFGKVGHFYYLIARAEDNRTVEPNRRTQIHWRRNFLHQGLERPTSNAT